MSIEVVYVLLADGDMTLHSIPTPFGAAVRSKAVAQAWSDEASGYDRGFRTLVVADEPICGVAIGTPGNLCIKPFGHRNPVNGYDDPHEALGDRDGD